jgi:AcrR family transcriptional regulator
LEATLELASERGYDGTSIALVTERTGLPASSIYWHFRNKDELLAATVEYSYVTWRREAPTWEARATFADTRAEIHDRLQRAARAIVDSPAFWRLGLMLGLEHRLVEPAARRRYLDARSDTERAIAQWWVQVLGTILTESGRAGEVADEDVATVGRRLARFHLALMDGLFMGLIGSEEWDLTRTVGLVSDGLYVQAQRWLGVKA